MADSPRYRRSKVTGRFTKMGDSIEDIKNVSATDTMPGMSAVRPAPEADGIGQGDEYPPGIRRAMLLDPRDVNFHNGALRTAARDSGPCDPSPYLTGVDGPETPATWPPSVVHVYRDGGRIMSPRSSEDIQPGRGRSHG